MMIAAAALSAAACGGDEIMHANVEQRPSHNQVYTVSAEPVMIDGKTGWVNIKVEIDSALGKDSVAFNLIIR